VNEFDGFIADLLRRIEVERDRIAIDAWQDCAQKMLAFTDIIANALALIGDNETKRDRLYMIVVDYADKMRAQFETLAKATS